MWLSKNGWKTVSKEDSQFKPGNKGGPGRPQMPDDVRQAKTLTQAALELALSKYLLMNLEELKKAKADPETPMIDLLIISVVMHGISRGDQNRVDFLMNRLVGKVKQQIEHSGEINNPYMNKTREELEALVKERLEKK
jgi:hypothetical protein